MIPPIASRFVAGETAAEALDRAEALHGRGVGTILNLLGEHYEDREDADADAAAYVRLLEDAGDLDARVRVSVKPSQLGLGIEESLFREHLSEIIESAEPGGLVWIDMEDHTTTDATLDAFADLAREHPDTVGVCLQANLKRTPDDVRRLADVPGKLRLVKGAYAPPPEHAYRDAEAVNRAYTDLLDLAFREFGGDVAVATHDDRMIDRARELGEEHGVDVEVQMLMGVREEHQYELADEFDVWQYVPYGDRWASYFYRRVAERKENVLFALRAVLGR